ncbi:uncharacterized protein K489DRAFT_296264, partial [Dissoconium aciculare CBS 342.82]|uniref:JmjC domain-containing protein n=1 Tax=Dissoconium aciculare CBS 342.82 TaxID=1314786 RepID=A0A6J3LQJ4_9PEZI
NALNMPDYLSAAEPAFLQKHSFKLLKTLAWRQMSSSGKAADITECLRFNIFGCTGAFSAPHCDILSGTYVTCVFGIKLWMWVDPNKMTAADWAEYERAGEKWIPTRAPIYGVLVRPGFTFVMPPGQRIIHAVHTVQTSVMTGGMFWDEACVVQHIHNCAYFLKNPSLTNEPTVLDFGETFTCLESLIRDSRPHLDTPALHKSILEVMRLFCKCSPPCSAQCRCR